MILLRVPYPMGFYAKGFDGRIDDPNAGWKGRGLWSTSGDRTPWLKEGGKGSQAARRAHPGAARSAGALSGRIGLGPRLAWPQCVPLFVCSLAQLHAGNLLILRSIFRPTGLPVDRPEALQLVHVVCCIAGAQS